jgi:hypothetical protein
VFRRFCGKPSNIFALFIYELELTVFAVFGRGGVGEEEETSQEGRGEEEGCEVKEGGEGGGYGSAEHCCSEADEGGRYWLWFSGLLASYKDCAV